MLQVIDLVAGYEQRVLIRNLFFYLPQPAFVAIVGHNGAGKSTLFKTFTQALPYQGQILVADQDLQSFPNPAAAGVLAHLPQKNHISFPIRVRDLLVMGLFRKKRFFEQYSDQDYDRGRQVLADLEISHLADREFNELSGGEQQLVWLGQLMLQDAALNLLDEPTQQLDIYHKKRVFTLLEAWVRQYRKTVLCITHDLASLYGHEGYLLNLSKPEPALEVLSDTSVRENIGFLEAKPF
jgi:iron complex transport system ATP-binding protein